MNAHELRIEQFERELGDAERRVASLHQRVYGGKRPYDPVREAALKRAVDGARERLARERSAGPA